MLAELAEGPLEEIFTGRAAREADAGERIEIRDLCQIDVRVRSVEPRDRAIRRAERPDSEVETSVAAVEPRSGLRDFEEAPRPMQRSKERWEPILVDRCKLAREVTREVVAAFEKMKHTGEIAVAAQLPVLVREEDFAHARKLDTRTHLIGL